MPQSHFTQNVTSSMFCANTSQYVYILKKNFVHYTNLRCAVSLHNEKLAVYLHNTCILLSQKSSLVQNISLPDSYIHTSKSQAA